MPKPWLIFEIRRVNLFLSYENAEISINKVLLVSVMHLTLLRFYQDRHLALEEHSNTFLWFKRHVEKRNIAEKCFLCFLPNKVLAKDKQWDIPPKYSPWFLCSLYHFIINGFAYSMPKISQSFFQCNFIFMNLL